MNDRPNAPHRVQQKTLRPRRLVLMASVAGISMAAVAVVSGSNRPLNLPAGIISSAHASEVAQNATGFADLVAKVKPAVISVRVKINAENVTERNDEGDDQDQSGSPFGLFPQQFEGPNGRHAAPQRHQMVTGEGSGFFISPDGYAVTNNHVVDHAKSVEVTTDDGNIYTAKVIGTDPKTDLALIKVDGKHNFIYAKFSDQAPRIGDWVVAVGNPFGLGGTVTAGIISASGRDIGAGDNYIQIDAPINKGNSGGPAFNMNGEVIGVNTAIYSPSGGSVGIGFDIPAKTVKLIIAQLRDKGSVTRGWLGVQIQPVTADIANSIGIKQAEGAIVDDLQSNSPAIKAGIEAGDVITAVNGTAVKDTRDLARNISMMAPGSSVKLDVLHKGVAKSVTIVLGKMQNQRQAKAADRHSEEENGTPRLGFSLAPANEVAGAGKTGVVVTTVDPNSPAVEHGSRPATSFSVGEKTVANQET